VAQLIKVTDLSSTTVFSIDDSNKCFSSSKY